MTPLHMEVTNTHNVALMTVLKHKDYHSKNYTSIKTALTKRKTIG